MKCNKKGFTLMELLAVIVILAIIALIAAPIIIQEVERSRTEVYNLNKKTMVEATKNYLSINLNKLPSLIGDTIELNLTELTSKNLIKEIDNPWNKNKCNGYVLITKVNEQEYNYNPYLNCFNDISSSNEDRLIANYKFDNFQEPTQNLIQHMSINGHGSSWSIEDEQYLGNPVYVNTVTNPNIGNNFGFRMGNPNVLLDKQGQKYITISFYSKVIISPGNLYGYVQVKYTDDTIEKHSWKYNPTDWWKETYANNWQKVVGVATLNQTKTPESITAWYVYKDNAPAGQIEISKIQMEQKSYDTPYTETNRTGILVDYSLNNNHADLNTTTTPTWVDNGSYLFDTNTRIDLPLKMNNTNYGLSDAKYTFSMWLKINKHNSQGTGVILGSAYYSGFGTFIQSDGTSYTKIGTYFRNKVSQYQTTTTDLELNKWYFITSVLDKPNKIIKFYLNGELLSAREITVDEFLYEDKDFSINRMSQTGGNGPWANISGYIDDVRIYNRILDNNEIEFMYKTSHY